VVYCKFHLWLTRATKYPFPQTATTVQDTMLEYLTAQKDSETIAAQWFCVSMTCDEEGAGMLAHSNIGSSANNMGNESHFKWLKAACNSMKHVSLNHFLASLLVYLEDCCAAEYEKIVSMLSLTEEDLEELKKRVSTVCICVCSQDSSENMGKGAALRLGLRERSFH
jgi:hypothetical protein